MRNDFHSTHQAQARQFLKDYGATFQAIFLGWICPAWCEGTERRGGADLEHMHGPKWLIVLRRPQQDQAITLDFWSSYASSHERQAPGKRFVLGYGRLPEGGPKPTPYDVLACLSSDIHCPESFADWCAEYGDDDDSLKALDTYQRCRELSEKLHGFFPAKALDDLAEIQ